MADDPRPIDYAGYGAIYALHGVLAASLDSLVFEVMKHGTVDTYPYLAVADGMLATLPQLTATLIWGDAQTQMLALAQRYRELIVAMTVDDPVVFRMAAAELKEAQTVAAAALHRLANRLSLVDVPSV